MNNMENLTPNELISKLSPLIEPLKVFESMEDKKAYTRTICQQRRQSIKSSQIVAYIVTPVLCLIAFFILNFRVILHNPPAFMRLIVLGVIGLPIFYFYLYFKLVNKRKIDAIDNEENQAISDIEEAQLDFITPYLGAVTECLPTKYQYSYAVSSFCSYLQNGRAGSLKDAINLYEEELHRNRMEQMQSQILQQQKYQTSLAAVSAVANVATAFNTASAASSLKSINDSL
ncbi:hypothetical protein [Butyrivibrio sp. AE2032]|uniref:hypothetical protein n=1 Tax=Butyrivibrio sp. AE2032 TaxID=1458463 RepID=UPI000550616F|nr:hypothetical protein [Butyrivibrio sp. AE2032]